MIDRQHGKLAVFGRLWANDIMPDDVAVHVKFLRAQGGGSSGYTADLLEAVSAQRDELIAALKDSYRRLNESGTGEMRLIDTIHSTAAIMRAVLAKSNG